MSIDENLETVQMTLINIVVFDWMTEPCRSCDEKEKDFGGCRCQAFMLTGDASKRRSCV